MKPWYCSPITVLLFLSLAVSGQTKKADYLNYLRQAADIGGKDSPQAVQTWKDNLKPNELWGYDPPAHPVYLADLLGFLYQETGNRSYAEKVRDILAGYGDYRRFYPLEKDKRSEYRQGIPAIPNIFLLPGFCRAYQSISGSGVVDASAKERIEGDLAFSLDSIFHFPEWGAHNRAMLRAECLYYGSIVLASHPHAGRWRQMAEVLAGDSLHQWEIEDATGYHSIWLLSLFSYAELSGRTDVLTSFQVRFYLDYFAQLLTPHGNIADFGDSHWNGGWERFVPVFEKAAALYRNPHYKYVAQQLALRAIDRMVRHATRKDVHTPVAYIGIGSASLWIHAYRWADDSVPAKAPDSLSQEALDDLVGKKMLFRNGWKPTDTMLLLNYRDEGDGGRLGRDFLRQTLSVEEEKMHHGHADENSIALLMSGGSVLLHDGGYRPDLPSGPYGAYRADYFHNRVVARLDKRDKKQDVYEFLRNSGAYRRVTTQKIDFQHLKDVDVSRTRLIDDNLGYQWDRVVTYLKKENRFVVVDGIQVQRSDYFTFTNLWHTRQVLQKGSQEGHAWFDTQYDHINGDPLPQRNSLLLSFPENAAGKQIGTFAIERHFQPETAIYQTVSRFYRAGDRELFITILTPHDIKDEAALGLKNWTFLPTDKPGQAFGLEISTGEEKALLCIKLDLEMDLAGEDVRPRYRQPLGMVKYNGMESDASYLFARIAKKQITYSATCMTKIVYQGQTLLEALPNTFGLQLDGTAPRTGMARWRRWEDSTPLKAKEEP